VGDLKAGVVGDLKTGVVDVLVVVGELKTGEGTELEGLEGSVEVGCSEKVRIDKVSGDAVNERSEAVGTDWESDDGRFDANCREEERSAHSPT